MSYIAANDLPYSEIGSYSEFVLVEGRVGYLATERFASSDVPPPSDVYAAGCVLFQMLNGKALMAEIGPRRTAALAPSRRAHGEFGRQRLDALPVGVPSAAADLLARILAWRPRDRPSAFVRRTRGTHPGALSAGPDRGAVTRPRRGTPGGPRAARGPRATSAVARVVFPLAPLVAGVVAAWLVGGCGLLLSATAGLAYWLFGG